MLIIEIINDGTGTNEDTNYTYKVFVNTEGIAFGEVRGHNRDEGWTELLRQILDEREDFGKSPPHEFHGAGVA